MVCVCVHVCGEGERLSLPSIFGLVLHATILFVWCFFGVARFSPVRWCCFSPPPFGWCCFPSSSFLCGANFTHRSLAFNKNQREHHPQEAEAKQHHPKQSEEVSSTTQNRREEEKTPAPRLIGKAAPPKRGEAGKHQPKEGQTHAAPARGWRRGTAALSSRPSPSSFPKERWRQHHQKEEEKCSTTTQGERRENSTTPTRKKAAPTQSREGGKAGPPTREEESNTRHSKEGRGSTNKKGESEQETAPPEVFYDVFLHCSNFSSTPSFELKNRIKTVTIIRILMLSNFSKKKNQRERETIRTDQKRKAKGVRVFLLFSFQNLRMFSYILKKHCGSCVALLFSFFSLLCLLSFLFFLCLFFWRGET